MSDTASLPPGRCWLAHQVDALGGWPLLGALVLLTAIGLGWWARSRRRARATEVGSTR